MLPRETSVRQLKMLRKLTKGKDIGDLTANDKMNKNIPNLQYITNPADNHIESYDDFANKDSKLQTIAFKSKLVNKSVKENNTKNENKYSDMGEYKNILKFNDFDKNWTAEDSKKTKRTEVGKDIIKETTKISKIEEFFDYDDEKQDIIDTILTNSDFNKDELEDLTIVELEEILDNLEMTDVDELSSDDNIYQNSIDDIKTFETFSIKSTKEKKQPEYTILGEEKEPKSNPNFGIGAVKAQEIKKITDFNVIDPPTPKERSILNAGVYIDNDIVNGRVNRIEGNDVYIESPDDPLVIKKFNIKDVVKIKKESK